MVTFTHDGVGTPAHVWRARPEWDDVPPADLAGFDRVVVLAAHPDDETLGAGGLITTAAARGLAVRLVVVTAGEHSHPDSPTHTPERLAALRRDELASALHELAPQAELSWGEVADGAVAAHESDLTAMLVDVLGDGRATLLVAPWRHDGHTDHEAAGRAAAAAARRTGATLWEYPIWWWHWSSPDSAPWADLRTLPLDADAMRRRALALGHHRSQTEPLSAAPGDEALLGPGLLAHFEAPRETYLVQPIADEALDELHRDQADPWGVDSRHYERRKRAIGLALLPRDRFASALEIGCSIGALTQELAARCDRLLAVDASAAAAAAAADRLAGTPGVDVRQLDVESTWPDGRFDLVVLSEVGYFLSPAALDAVIEHLRASLTPDGVVLLCHWRHPIHGWPLDGAAVHERFAASGLRPVQARHLERDVETLVLCSDAAWPEADR